MEGLDAAEHVVRFLQALHRYVIQRYFLQGGIYRIVEYKLLTLDKLSYIAVSKQYRSIFLRILINGFSHLVKLTGKSGVIRYCSIT